ncbi:hypothetical protein [Hyphomicrobium sp.]|uniref:hypothetical protein n=1 Tax=Hyphomicrobium sp. TaxID=82 RepID=UPI001D41910C|nr:hypothetical protein [Hyphomicrobium sp.]MBY0559918.1 hypothetical protein [Hyphomicrobium sp.]
MIIELINEACEEIRALLIEKNQTYGNSALEPVRIFSRADRLEGLKVRIDDQITRIMKGSELASESTIDDLVGYLMLLKIARRIEDAQAAAQAEKQRYDNYYRVSQPPPMPRAEAQDPLAGFSEGLAAFHQEHLPQQH